MKTKSIIAVLVVLCASLLVAQENMEKRKAAERLATLSITQEQVECLYSTILSEAKIKENTMEIYEDLYREFLNKHLNADSLKAIYRDLYYQNLEEDEIGELIKFYSSPKANSIMKKVSAMVPSAGNAIKGRLALSQKELVDKVEKRNAELKAEEETNKDFKRVLSSDSAFEIEIPSVWIANGDASDSTNVLSYISKIKTASIHVDMINKTIPDYDDYDFNNPEEDFTPLYEEQATLKTITSELVERLKARSAKVNILQNTEMNINGLSSVRMQLTDEIDTEKYYFYITYVEFKNCFYSVVCSAIEEIKEKIMPVFERISNSLKAVEKKK